MRHQYPQFLTLIHKNLTSSPSKWRVTKRKKIQKSTYKRKRFFLRGRLHIILILHPGDKSPWRHVILKKSGGQQEVPALLHLAFVLLCIIFLTATVHAYSSLLSGSHLKRAVTSSTFSLGTEDMLGHRGCALPTVAAGSWGTVALSFLCATQK